jgi:hypothetical protein
MINEIIFLSIEIRILIISVFIEVQTELQSIILN